MAERYLSSERGFGVRNTAAVAPLRGFQPGIFFRSITLLSTSARTQRRNDILVSLSNHSEVSTRALYPVCIAETESLRRLSLTTLWIVGVPHMVSGQTGAMIRLVWYTSKQGDYRQKGYSGATKVYAGGGSLNT